jgi:hypothetical protein
MKKSARTVAALLALVFAMAVAAPAFAGGTPEPTGKCNSGRGNGSEVAGNDCDPGNSGGHNNGGDN